MFLFAGTGQSNVTYVEDVFSAYTYTGNGSTQTITNGVNLSGLGGMVWCKDRVDTYGQSIYDSVRGINHLLEANGTGGDLFGSYSGVSAFDSNGFSLGSYAGINENNKSCVSWSFAQANKFFKIVTWVGDNTSNRAIPHTLGIAPGMIIAKATSTTSNWSVYHRGMTAGYSCYLNLTNAQTSGNLDWGSSAPTATNIYVDLNTNETGKTYIGYIFAHDTSANGLIQCGTVTTDGNGNATVNLGWEPQFVMFKGSSVVQDWYIEDAARGFNLTSSLGLRANTSGAEFSGGAAFSAPTATGFTITGFSISATYIYLAIRRGPMKLPTVGTQVYKGLSRAGTGAAVGVPQFGQYSDVYITKRRDNAPGVGIEDRLRGAGATLFTNLTSAEYTDTIAITSFNMDGVTMGADLNQNTVNNASGTYMNWALTRYPGVFDEVCYTGTSIAHTESHNLGVVPELMIVKYRGGTGGWAVYSAALGNTGLLFLNSTAGNSGPASTYWNSTSPTATVFSLGTNSVVNFSTGTYIAYLFATLAGISKVGSYTGNGSSLSLNMGFSGNARFFLCKRTDSTGDWFVWDSTRGINGSSANDPHLSLNTTAAEVNTTNDVEPYTTGITVVENATTHINVNAATYIYLAFS